MDTEESLNIQYQSAMDQFTELDKPSRDVQIKVFGNYEGTSWYTEVCFHEREIELTVRTSHYEDEDTAFNAGIKIARSFYKSEKSPFK